MKALTILQPWASLIALGQKRIETRSWSTSYRGPLVIHAGKRSFVGQVGTFDVEKDNPRGTDPSFLLRGPIDWPYRLPLGAVVATAKLVDVLPILDAVTYPKLPLPFPHIWRWGDGALGIVRNQDEVAEFIREPERSFGDYTPGRFGWILADVRPLDTPVGAKGRQGFWEWDGVA